MSGTRTGTLHTLIWRHPHGKNTMKWSVNEEHPTILSLQMGWRTHFSATYASIALKLFEYLPPNVFFKLLIRYYMYVSAHLLKIFSNGLIASYLLSTYSVDFSIIVISHNRFPVHRRLLMICSRKYYAIFERITIFFDTAAEISDHCSAVTHSDHFNMKLVNTYPLD